MNKETKKIPGALIAIVAVIVAIAVFVPTVYLPYKEKLPQMNADHEAAVSQMEVYDQAIINQANIEKDIDTLKAEWEEFQKDMFVDANSSLNDLQTAVDELDNIKLVAFDRGVETQDPNEAYSFTGSPLYYVSISLKMYTDNETLLDLLKYIEQESVGCYYVKTLNATTLKKDEEVGQDYVAKEGDLNVSMEIYLYYYNQDITIDPALLAGSDTDTATDTAK